jgi:molybdopterin adenylyltransferase
MKVARSGANRQTKKTLASLFSHLQTDSVRRHRFQRRSIDPAAASMLRSMSPTATLSGRTAIVLTVSDRCFAGTQTDLSGPAIVRLLTDCGALVIEALTLPDEPEPLAAALRSAATRAALVLTTGGTGLAPRDITPEATLAVCTRLVPGLAELIRQDGARHTPFAALGRGICGVCSPNDSTAGALILNLPGRPRGAESSLRAVLPLLPHALDLLAGQTEHPN